MIAHTVGAIGIVWYQRQHYGRILEVMADADTLPTAYDEWRQQAERLERELKRQGQIVVRAVIDPDEFPGWCATRGLNIDAQARSRFASDAASRDVSQTH